MKEQIIKLLEGGFNANRIAAMLMIQKSEVLKHEKMFIEKKNTSKPIPAVAVEKSKKKK